MTLLNSKHENRFILPLDDYIICGVDKVRGSALEWLVRDLKLTDSVEKELRTAYTGKATTLEDFWKLAKNEDWCVRHEIAIHDTTPIEVLQFLTKDINTVVSISAKIALDYLVPNNPKWSGK